MSINLFDRPLSRLQNFTFQHKETQISAQTEQNKEETTTDKQIQEMSVEDDKDSPEEESPESADSNSEKKPRINPFIRMIRAFAKSDFTEARDAYEEMIKGAKSEDDKRRFEADYLYYCYTKASDSKALGKLHKLSSHKSTRKTVIFRLAGCYLATKDYSKAREVYEKAREVEEDEVYSSDLTSKIARCWSEEGDPDAGLEEVVARFQVVEKEESKKTLYEAMAFLYEAKDCEKMRAIMLEKLLEFEPNNTRARFDAAYSQSNANLTAISIYNYETLLGLDPKYEYALNNLGIQYGFEGLKLKSVEYLKKSSEIGNTLAMANIAYRLIEAGFYDESAEVLSRANEFENPHLNVASAKAKLEESYKEENDKNKSLSDTGDTQRQFLREYAQAYVEQVEPNPFIGAWVLPNGGVCTVEQEDDLLNLISLEFKYEDLEYDDKRDSRYKFEARYNNRSAEGSIHTWQIGIIDDGTFIKGPDALATVSSDGETLSILEFTNSPEVLQNVLRLKRIS